MPFSLRLQEWWQQMRKLRECGIDPDDRNEAWALSDRKYEQ